MVVNETNVKLEAEAEGSEGQSKKAAKKLAKEAEKAAKVNTRFY